MPVRTSKKLLIFTTHPIQYQVPIWRALASGEDVEPLVVFRDAQNTKGYVDPEFGIKIQWDIPLLEGYLYIILKSGSPLRWTLAEYWRHWTRLLQIIDDFSPDCVMICAYAPFVFYVGALLASLRMQIPIIMRAETTDRAVPRSSAQAIMRSIVLRAMYKQLAGFLAIGQASRQHYLAKGVDTHKIGFSPYNIDTELFAQMSNRWLAQRETLRTEFGLGDQQIVFLFSGKLVPKKDPLTIAKAISLLPHTVREKVALLVVGEGELRSEFEARCREMGCRSYFVGFQNQTQLGSFYAMADFLILPSTFGETWGLVVNEAMQFGLPAIVSDLVGSWHDLVNEETGFVFPAGDAVALANILTDVTVLTKDKIAAMRCACQEQIKSYSVEAATDGIIEMVKRVLTCE